MNRRRMMMSGKPRPLFVFTPGAPLQNYSEIKRKTLSDTTWYEASSYIEYGKNYKDVRFPRSPHHNATLRRVYRLTIPLKAGYKKLFVKARSSTSEYNAYISWSTEENGENDNLRVILDTEKVVEFDISKRDKSGGMFYLFFQPSSWGESYLAVTDIHFE